MRKAFYGMFLGGFLGAVAGGGWGFVEATMEAVRLISELDLASEEAVALVSYLPRMIAYSVIGTTIGALAGIVFGFATTRSKPLTPLGETMTKTRSLLTLLCMATATLAADARAQEYRAVPGWTYEGGRNPQIEARSESTVRPGEVAKLTVFCLVDPVVSIEFPEGEDTPISLFVEWDGERERHFDLYQGNMEPVFAFDEPRDAVRRMRAGSRMVVTNRFLHYEFDLAGFWAAASRLECVG